MTFRVRLDSADAARVLSGLPPSSKRAIRDALRGLAEDPFGNGPQLDVRALDRDGKEPRVYRLRVGEWRVAFAVRGREVLVLRIFHRRDGYGWLERLG